MMSGELSFTGIHVVSGNSNDDSWFIHGEFSFSDYDDFEEFKSGIQGAFEYVKGYPVPTILTPLEYANMHSLPSTIDMMEADD